MPPLDNPKHEIVAQHLAKGATGENALIAAGYSELSARRNSTRLTTNSDILSRQAELQERMAKKAVLEVVPVLEELRRLVFLDPRGFFDESGNLKPVKDLTDEQAAAISSLEVIKKNAEAGDGKIDTIHKIRFWSKSDAIEKAMKHLNLLVEKVDVNVTVVTAERAREVSSARKRLERVLPAVVVKTPVSQEDE